jgi:hypothetical protein
VANGYKGKGSWNGTLAIIPNLNLVLPQLVSMLSCTELFQLQPDGLFEYLLRAGKYVQCHLYNNGKESISTRSQFCLNPYHLITDSTKANQIHDAVTEVAKLIHETEFSREVKVMMISVLQTALATSTINNRKSGAPCSIANNIFFLGSSMETRFRHLPLNASDEEVSDEEVDRLDQLAATIMQKSQHLLNQLLSTVEPVENGASTSAVARYDDDSKLPSLESGVENANEALTIGLTNQSVTTVTGPRVCVVSSQDATKVQRWVELLESRPDPDDEDAMAVWMAILMKASSGGRGRAPSAAPWEDNAGSSMDMLTAASDQVEGGENKRKHENHEEEEGVHLNKKKVMMLSSSQLQSAEQDGYTAVNNDPMDVDAPSNVANKEGGDMNTVHEKCTCKSLQTVSLSSVPKYDAVDQLVALAKLTLVPIGHEECANLLAKKLLLRQQTNHHIPGKELERVRNAITQQQAVYKVPSEELNSDRDTITLSENGSEAATLLLGRHGVTNIHWKGISRELCDVSIEKQNTAVIASLCIRQPNINKHRVFIDGKKVNAALEAEIQVKDGSIIALFGPTGFAYRVYIGSIMDETLDV